MNIARRLWAVDGAS